MIKALAVAILALAGCSDSTGPTIEGIEVTLSLSREEIAVGDTVEIRVLVTNATASELVFVTGVCDILVYFLRSRKVVRQLPDSCNSISHQHTLGPGESVERVLLFDGTTERFVNNPGGRSFYRPFPMDPGTYMLFAGLSGIPGSDLVNRSEAVVLRIVDNGEAGNRQKGDNLP